MRGLHGRGREHIFGHTGFSREERPLQDEDERAETVRHPRFPRGSHVLLLSDQGLHLRPRGEAPLDRAHDPGRTGKARLPPRADHPEHRPAAPEGGQQECHRDPRNSRSSPLRELRKRDVLRAGRGHRALRRHAAMRPLRFGHEAGHHFLRRMPAGKGVKEG